MKELMMTLSGPMGVSGHEKEISEALNELRSDEYGYGTDHIGNLIWRNSPGTIKVLFTAHMDEIGLMVSGYDKDQLKVVSVGGIDPRTLPNTQWRCANGYHGVIGLPAPHITNNRDKVIAIEDLRLDIGLDEEELKEEIPIGTVFVNTSEPFCTGNNFFSRNVDNRAGCAALLLLAEELKYEEGVAFAFLVREEVGLMGARAFINDDLQAEYIINLDVCVSDKLGKGPVLMLKDGGYMADFGMVERLRELGAENVEVSSSGGTSDHAVGQLFAKTCGVSFPSAYIHSGVGKVNLKDVEGAVDLCVKFVRNL